MTAIPPAIAFGLLFPITMIVLVGTLKFFGALHGFGGGPASVVMMKAAVLAGIITLLVFAVPLSICITVPVWWLGLMVLFGLDVWQCDVMVFINWSCNTVLTYGLTLLCAI